MPPWGKRAGFVVHEREPFNGEPPPGALAGQDLTPVEAFYARNHGPIPDVDPAAFRLAVDGLVRRPLSLSLADLQALPGSEVVATLQCAGNRRAGLTALRPIPDQALWGSGAVSTARWTGVRLADVLAAAGPAADAAHVAFLAPDVAPEAEPPQPYGASVELAKARSPEVLLAWAMNGELLPRAHGGPLRVVVPGYVGARSVKWVQRVSVAAQPWGGWFQQVAYRLQPAAGGGTATNDGPPLTVVPVTSDILEPADGAVVPAGAVTVTGYAYAGGLGIAAVEMSSDGGASWLPVELAPAPGPWSWRHWRAVVDLPPGRARLAARAVDAAGGTQPEDASRLWNPKGYGNTSQPVVTLTVV